MDSAIDLPVVLMSIHPEFAETILSGKKKVELRRTPPKKSFEFLALYATTPVKSVIGVCRISSVVSDIPSTLWNTYGSMSGITRHAFRDYFGGCSVGYAIVIEKTIRCVPAIHLKDLGAGYTPPQNFIYIPREAIIEQIRALE